MKIPINFLRKKYLVYTLKMLVDLSDLFLWKPRVYQSHRVLNHKLLQLSINFGVIWTQKKYLYFESLCYEIIRRQIEQSLWNTKAHNLLILVFMILLL